MATPAEIQALIEGPDRGVVYLRAYITGELVPFRNSNGSGPMFDEDYEIWWNRMQKDHEERDRARRHKIGWNARAVAALSELDLETVREVHAKVHDKARTEWLESHGWGLLLSKVVRGWEWVNGLMGAIGACIPGWGWIVTAISAVLSPILRKQVSDQEARTAKLKPEEAALRWLNERGIPPPLNETGEVMFGEELVRYVLALQREEHAGEDVREVWREEVAPTLQPEPEEAPASDSSSPTDTASPVNGGDVVAGLAAVAAALVLLFWVF